MCLNNVFHCFDPPFSPDAAAESRPDADVGNPVDKRCLAILVSDVKLKLNTQVFFRCFFVISLWSSKVHN